MRINSYILVSVMFLISSCGTNNALPTQNVVAIQTSAAGTAWASYEQTATASIPTDTPLPTSTPLPTDTPMPPKETFVISVGHCLGFDYIPTGDPTAYEHCDVKEKTQAQLASGDAVSYSSFDPSTYPSFCAIHRLDGTYVTSFVDALGAGEAACTFVEAGTIIETPLPPENLFVISVGHCLGFDYIPTGDPTAYEHCDVKEKTQAQLASGDAASYSSFAPTKYPSFCALHKLDGTYVTSSVDALGAGEAVCTAP
jgi:hypothetical protein